MKFKGALWSHRLEALGSAISFLAGSLELYRQLRGQPMLTHVAWWVYALVAVALAAWALWPAFFPVAPQVSDASSEIVSGPAAIVVRGGSNINISGNRTNMGTLLDARGVSELQVQGNTVTGDLGEINAGRDVHFGPRHEIYIEGREASQDRGAFPRFTYREQVYEAIKDLVDTINGRWLMQDRDRELQSRAKHLDEVKAWAAHYRVSPAKWASENEPLKEQLAAIALRLNGQEPGYDPDYSGGWYF